MKDNILRRLLKHPKRTAIGISVSLIALALFLGITSYLNYRAEKNSYPIISILSSQEHQNDAMEYKLEIEVKHAEEIEINHRKAELIDGKASMVIPLTSKETDIDIEAVSKYKKASSKEITITRNETGEEKERRLKAEALAEQLKIAKQEREAKEKREKAIYETLKEKLDQIYEDPDLEYILYSDALMDDWEKKANEEVAKQYGITTDELFDIYVRGFEKYGL